MFPRKHLQERGSNRGHYNRIANSVIAQSEINVAIGDTSRVSCFAQHPERVNEGERRFGGIVDRLHLRENFIENCLPERLIDGDVPNYDDLIAERRSLMALKIKAWFEVLS